MQSEMMTSDTDRETDLRTEALRRLKKKRDFRGHLLVYLVVNAVLWAIWGVMFGAVGVWFPWPLFATFGWGIGLVFHGWDAYGRKPFTEEDIRREALRLRGE